MALVFTLFTAGVLTILLPCILPLIPIVLGVSIVDRNPWRPLLTIAGMIVSFVFFSFIINVTVPYLAQRFFPELILLPDYIRVATYYVLLLFGLGFAVHRQSVALGAAALGGLVFFYLEFVKITSVPTALVSGLVAAVIGTVLMYYGGKIAGSIQQFGTSVQQKTRQGLGSDNPLAAFFMGLTMGLVWAPCAGPALAFALSLLRDQPGPIALFYIFIYGLGTGLPLLLIAYGGQRAIHSVRFLAQYSGKVKTIAGVILIVTALALQFRIFKFVETWLVSNTPIGNIGVDVEQSIFGERVGE